MRACIFRVFDTYIYFSVITHALSPSGIYGAYFYFVPLVLIFSELVKVHLIAALLNYGTEKRYGEWRFLKHWRGFYCIFLAFLRSNHFNKSSPMRSSSILTVFLFISVSRIGEKRFKMILELFGPNFWTSLWVQLISTEIACSNHRYVSNRLLLILIGNFHFEMKFEDIWRFSSTALLVMKIWKISLSQAWVLT